MKLKNKNDIDKFMEAVRECEGDVFLYGTDGSKFNLKSELSLYVGIGALIQDQGENLELFTSVTADSYRLIQFFVDTNQGVV